MWIKSKASCLDQEEPRSNLSLFSWNPEQTFFLGEKKNQKSKNPKQQKEEHLYKDPIEICHMNESHHQQCKFTDF